MRCVSREAESSSEPRCCGNTVPAVKTDSCQFQSELESETTPSFSDIPVSTMDEFSRYEESVFGACEGNNGQDHDEYSKSSSFWELMMTMYFPLAAIWLRRSVFGITMLVRTVILGHLLHLVFGNFSEWMNEKSPSWIQAFWQPVGPHTKQDLKAWPPPALTALALFTVITLVVHPDGFTWVMMGKVKNAILSIFQSLSECWQLLITDYGVMPSIIASVTLALLICLMFIMLRSVSPKRTRRASPAPDKKKKRRKGHARHRGGSGKIKSAQSTPSTATDASAAPTITRDATSPTRSLGENAPDLTPLTPNSFVRNIPKSLGSTIKTEESNRELEDLPETAVCQTPILPLAANKMATQEKDLKGRTRVPSVSTLDTTTMSDDLSCGSTSIRSLPSIGVSAPSTLNSSFSVVQKSSFSSAPSSMTNSGDQKLKSGRSNTRGNKRLGNTNPKIRTNTAKGTEGPSRWDALKPASAVKHIQPPERQNFNPKPVENLGRPQHLSSSTSHRPSNRRVGQGASRKGRGNSQLVPNRTNNSRSPTRTNRSATRSPVSPPSLVHHDVSRFSLPAPNSLPPPPPGLDPTSTAAAFERFNEDSRLFPDQPRCYYDEVPFLLPPTDGNASPARSWDLAPNQPAAQAYVSPSFLNAQVESDNNNLEWNNPGTIGSSPARAGTSSLFPGSPASLLGYGGVKENPFAPDTVMENSRGSEEQIEADLQELGGQMVGSILDF